MRSATTFVTAVLVLLTASAASTANAQQVKAHPVVTDLDNPCGVAVHPQTGHVFISSHPAVYRLVPGKPGKVYLEVIGFPTDIYGKGPKYEIGPLGLGFLDPAHLVVGDGSRPDGEELVRIYAIPEQPREKPIREDEAVYTLGPIKPSEKTAKGEGNFYGVAVSRTAIFVSCNGDDTKGWVAKAPVVDGKPGTLEPTIATKEATGVDAPVPLTFNADGELVVGQMGEINVPGDSLLTFYDPETGALKRNLPTGLNDIAGLAYSPKTGKLYAVDFSWMDTSKGGLFRLDIEGDKVNAVRIVDLDKPTALAFDGNGALYITVFGTASKEGEKPGKLLWIKPGL